MKSCSKCFHPNPDSETLCERCAMDLDLKSASMTHTCPAGHPMDSTSTVCAFCENDRRSNGGGTPQSRAGVSSSGETLLEDGRPAGRLTVDENSRSSSHQAVSQGENPSVRKTVVDSGVGQPNRPGQELPSDLRKGGGTDSNSGRAAAAGKVTVFGQASSIISRAGAGIARKIVGILVTYTWKPEGQVFNILQGRTLIGKDPTQADIVVEQDKTLSGINTTIQFQASFRINDKDSMNGTFLNGVPVEEFVALPNYSTIRTGSTTWTFIAIDRSGMSD